MSMADILEELPKLSRGERRELYRRILSPEAEQAESDSCDQATAEAFVLMDPMEADHAYATRRLQG